jgi:hypothetical protein
MGASGFEIARHIAQLWKVETGKAFFASYGSEDLHQTPGRLLSPPLLIGVSGDRGEVSGWKFVGNLRVSHGTKRYVSADVPEIAVPRFRIPRVLLERGFDGDETHHEPGIETVMGRHCRDLGLEPHRNTY